MCAVTITTMVLFQCIPLPVFDHLQYARTEQEDLMYILFV